MRSEALEITIESKGHAVWLTLAGPFHNEQVPNIREKISGLLQDGNNHIVLDLENVSDLDDGVVPMFVSMLNTVREKKGDLQFVFKSPNVSRYFEPYRNLFPIHSDALALSLAQKSFWGRLKHRSKILSRKTGVRLSRPVATMLLICLVGWFLSLGFIIRLQSRRIHEQQTQIHRLAAWKQQADLELRQLRDRLKPLEQLGVLPDSLAASDPAP
ncbi:MAG: STAS domain-containing protein [Chitinivibrionales bacterium]|nr:STAS domain-containing protein [Chitinivibrionales bacterium]